MVVNHVSCARIKFVRVLTLHWYVWIGLWCTSCRLRCQKRVCYVFVRVRCPCRCFVSVFLPLFPHFLSFFLRCLRLLSESVSLTDMLRCIWFGKLVCRLWCQWAWFVSFVSAALIASLRFWVTNSTTTTFASVRLSGVMHPIPCLRGLDLIGSQSSVRIVQIHETKIDIRL